METLGVFAKYWAPGEVKTRLAAAIGADAAAAIYRESLFRTLQRLRGAADRCVLAYWPPERETAFAPLAEWGWRPTPQSPGDLGQRMRQFFNEAFAKGARRVVLVGSDSPTLPLGRIRQAFELLHDHRAALGPTPDGGYYLVGAAEETPPIFDGVPWSTPDVWPETVARLKQAGAAFAVLPEWYDVDDVDDLQRLARELEALLPEDPAWTALAEAVRG